MHENLLAMLYFISVLENSYENREKADSRIQDPVFLPLGRTYVHI
jgi:hypothetical protein